jgi:uncharacterized membrane protein
MKKILSLLFNLFLAIVAFAQDEKKPVVDQGMPWVKIVGLVLVAGFVIWGIRRATRKK